MLASGEVVPSHLPEKILLPEFAGPTARWIEPHFADEQATGERARQLLPGDARVAFSPLSLREIFVTVTRSLRSNPPSVR
jgi:hypothetical protein